MNTPLSNMPLIASDIKQLIEQSRQNVAIAVNAEITLLYWNIGKRINQEVLNFNRAEYGKQIVDTLSKQLTLDYGDGWSKRQQHHCLRVAEVFPEVEIVHALRTQLSWLHKAVEIAQQRLIQRN